MASSRHAANPSTQDYRTPRIGERVSSAPPEPLASGQATRRGVGHDERRPPPAVLPRRAKRVDAAIDLALATGDALFRATLARGLVRAGCDVHIVQSANDVRTLAESPEVAILDFDAEDAPTLFGAFHEACPGLPVLALSSEREKIHRGLQLMRLCTFEVLDRRAPIADVLDAVKRLRA